MADKTPYFLLPYPTGNSLFTAFDYPLMKNSNKIDNFLDERQESLYTINLLIQQCLGGFEILANEDEKKKTLQNKKYLIITSFIIIQLHSLLEEWDHHFKGSTEITEFKSRLKVLLDEIKAFKDIRLTRSSLFAHSRNKDRKNPLLVNKDQDYNIPVGIYDLVFVAGLLQILHKELIKTFSIDFERLAEYGLRSNSIKQVKQRFTNKGEVEDAIAALSIRINNHS